MRAKGFDHTTQGAYAVAAGVSRALGLDRQRTANAIAIAGTSLNALRVTRTGALSHWKGLAYPATAFARHPRGVPGDARDHRPARGVRGQQGLHRRDRRPVSRSTGQREDLESVRRTILKRFNAEIHSQSAIEALLELRAAHAIEAAEVERVELDTFQVAYDIIGGGEEGSKYEIATKEEADHSLPYLLAVALLDGQVLPEQYRPERIAAARRAGAAAPRRGAPGRRAVKALPRRAQRPDQGSTCATGACSSASSTTTRASTAGR